MKNMTISLYTNHNRGAAFYDIIANLTPGSDIQILPREKSKGANPNKVNVEISDSTERGKALQTILRAQSQNPGLFIPKEKHVSSARLKPKIEEKPELDEQDDDDESIGLANFDFEGYGMERPDGC